MNRPALWLCGMFALLRVLPAAGAEGDRLSNDLTGHWRITRVAGDRPMLLEVDSADALIGKRVTITPTSVQLWTVFRGTVSKVSGIRAPLTHFAAVSDDIRAKLGAIGDREYDAVQVAFSRCSSHRRMLDGCVQLVFVRDPETGETALMTYPYGLAYLGR